MATMLTHPQVWGAIDRLAARYGFSASGLAKKAGLDPTSFTMDVVLERIRRHGDLFEGVLTTRQRLEPALKALR